MVINDVKMSINDILDIYSKGCMPALPVLATANAFFTGVHLGAGQGSVSAQFAP
jgi:hypothetical protein